MSPLADLYHFFRVSALGATMTLPLLGAASADRRLPPRRALGLLAVAAAFHAFAYVHNDVCDLELDRTQPRRAMYPLVGGRVAPRTALAVAVACVPLAFALDALAVGRPGARGRRRSLAAAFALLAAYNRWGKAAPLPPLTDLLQGVGWAALVRYGARAAGGEPTALTALLEGYEVLLIAMVNGVHGALRDLENDAARGARTTAILLGATAEHGAMRVPPAMLAYAAALQAALLALPAWGAARNLAGHGPDEHAAAAAALAAISAATVGVLAGAARGEAPAAEAGMAHLVLILSAPLALVAPGLPPPTRAALLGAHLLPLLSNDLTYDALRWAWAELTR